MGSDVLPSGDVSFVFTDIEGSTRLLRELGDSYHDLIDLHHLTLRTVWRDHGGAEINTEGDAFFVAFDDECAAVSAAVDAQRRIAAATWPGGHPLSIRAAVHTGFARPRHGDYAALAVNRAARLVAAANGGQVLVAGEVADRVRGRLRGAELVPLGRFRVRDFDDPPELYRVVAADLADVTTPPRVRPADRHNLVPRATSLVGRVADVAAVAEQLQPGTLVTLLGPGGVGKSRLATEVGLTLADRWDDGVWVTELSSVVQPELTAAAVARAMGIKFDADGWPLRDLVDHLAGRSTLLIIDGCEHLQPGPARFVEAVLAGCRGVAVLATSRAPLGVQGERTRRLAALPVEPTSTGGTAIDLFADRCGGVADDQLADVVALCRELDGLPLAIELAAARARSVPPAELVRQLRRWPDALRSSDGRLPGRQRSLDRLLDWSLDLLEPRARAVLERLTVFASGFRLDDAVVLCAPDLVDEGTAADLVWSLVDQSLVEVEPAAGETRYRLLTTVRTHVERRAAEEHLRDAGRRIAEIFVDELGPSRALERPWLPRMAAELDNVRALVARSSTPVAAAQSLAWSIGWYQDVTDDFRTGIDELVVAARGLDAATPERVGMLTMLCDLYLRVGEIDAAEAVLDDAEGLAARVGHPAWDEVALRRARGEFELRSGRPATAIELASEALGTGLGPTGDRARLWSLLAVALVSTGDVDGARHALLEELRAEEDADLDTFVATTHANLAEVMFRLDDLPAAAHHQLECLDRARAQRRSVLVAFSLMMAAQIAERLGDAVRAARFGAGADRELAAASYTLHDMDAVRRDELRDRVRSELGEARYEQAVHSDGSSNDDPADLIDAAADLLRTTTLQGVQP